MDKILSVDEYDLLEFFGRIPTQLDPDVPWTYNDSAYEATDSQVHVSFAIAPSVKDVRVLLKTGQVLVYELNAIGVDDVRYHNDKGRESLEVVISARDSIWLRIKPGISINHSVTGQT